MTLRSDAAQILREWLMDDCEFHIVNSRMYHAVSEADLAVVLDRLEQLAKSRLQCWRPGTPNATGDDLKAAAQMLRSLAASHTKTHFEIDLEIRRQCNGDLSALLMTAAGGGDVCPTLARLMARAEALRRVIKQATETAERMETQLAPRSVAV